MPQKRASGGPGRDRPGLLGHVSGFVPFLYLIILDPIGFLAHLS